jgi:hypothetical protein
VRRYRCPLKGKIFTGHLIFHRGGLDDSHLSLNSK